MTVSLPPTSFHSQTKPQVEPRRVPANRSSGNQTSRPAPTTMPGKWAAFPILTLPHLTFIEPRSLPSAILTPFHCDGIAHHTAATPFTSSGSRTSARPTSLTSLHSISSPIFISPHDPPAHGYAARYQLTSIQLSTPYHTGLESQL